MSEDNEKEIDLDTLTDAILKIIEMDPREKKLTDSILKIIAADEDALPWVLNSLINVLNHTFYAFNHRKGYDKKAITNLCSEFFEEAYRRSIEAIEARAAAIKTQRGKQ